MRVQAENPDPSLFVAPSLETAEMKALSQVAGGVAPALNDLLSVIVGRANQVLDSSAIDAADREALNQIYTASERAVSLIRQLLLFSGRHPIHPLVLDLNSVVEGLTPVLRRLVGERIEVEVRLGSSLPFTTADASMLEQVILGLVRNAQDAMPQSGKLELSTAALTIAESDLKAFPDGRPGTFVVLNVTDSGSGIAPEILPRIFEPFFTTRNPDRNVGLGLTTIFGIVQQHRGWISVESKVGTGSTFSVFLPGAPAGSRVQTADHPGALDRGAGETVLLIEDEPLVREFSASILTHLGYRVLQVSSADEALETWKWQRSRIRLVMSDVVLAGPVSGPELANRLHAEKPELAVILVSGHGPDILRRTVAVPSSFQFLQKPWRPQTLARVVRLLLDSRQP